MVSIDDKVFSASQIWQGTKTKHLRLDQLNQLAFTGKRRQVPSMGDTSARDISYQLLERVGLIGHPIFDNMLEGFAKVILKECLKAYVLKDTPSEIKVPESTSEEKIRKILGDK